MQCAELERVQKYFDGELEAASAAQVERHLETCAECQQHLQDLGRMRSLLRGPAARIAVPPSLRDRIGAALDREAGLDVARRPVVPRTAPGSFWLGLFSGVTAGAVAALAFVFLMPIFNGSLSGELVADHTRSLMTSHLIDVVSTDQHTVKPWFAGRTDVSPEVADFAQQGYRLLGGRVGEIGHRRAAVLVYRHGAHVIDVYSWAVRGGEAPQDTLRKGYRMVFWKQGDLGYCAVSDAGWTELEALAALIQDLSAHDHPG